MLRKICLELLAPQRCAACEERTHLLFCDACAPTVQRAVDPTRAVFGYGGAIETAIRRYKFQRRSDLAARLAAPLADSAAGFSEIDMVVPVPLHPTRLVERGFDQAALLALPVARRIRADYDPRALRRMRNTPKQSKLTRKARLVNVWGAFRCVRPVRGRKVLLIDDVATTGATLGACWQTLIEAGAASVTTFVLALRDDLTTFGKEEKAR